LCKPVSDGGADGTDSAVGVGWGYRVVRVGVLGETCG